MGMQEWLPQVQADYEECLSRLPPRSVGFLDRRLENGYTHVTHSRLQKFMMNGKFERP